MPALPALPALLSDAAIDAAVDGAIDAASVKLGPGGYDPWGFHPASAKSVYAFGKKVLWPWFRPEVAGIENIPPGRVLLVPNHAGQLPFDGAVIALACLLEGRPPRLVRALVERWFPTLPYVNQLFSRAGAVLGDPVNCRNLLEAEQAIVVFPEGAKGSGKIFQERYRLRAFGRGFMRLALQTKTPIVPVAVVGSEESIISVYNWEAGAKALGVPYFPLSPLLPVLGLGAYVPMPVKFRVTFGAPLAFDGPHDDEDAVIDEKVAVVRDTIQQMVDEGVRSRRSIFL